MRGKGKATTTLPGLNRQLNEAIRGLYVQNTDAPPRFLKGAESVGPGGFAHLGEEVAKLPFDGARQPFAPANPNCINNNG
jgi:hypothetical protein